MYNACRSTFYIDTTGMYNIILLLLCDVRRHFGHRHRIFYIYVLQCRSHGALAARAPPEMFLACFILNYMLDKILTLRLLNFEN